MISHLQMLYIPCLSKQKYHPRWRCAGIGLVFLAEPASISALVNVHEAWCGLGRLGFVCFGFPCLSGLVFIRTEFSGKIAREPCKRVNKVWCQGTEIICYHRILITRKGWP